MSENNFDLRFNKRFLQNGQNLGHFGSLKNFRLLEHKHVIYHFESSDLKIPNIYSVSQNIQISRFYESVFEFREPLLLIACLYNMFMF